MIGPVLYRPYVQRIAYQAPELNEDLYQTDRIFPSPQADNRYLGIVRGRRLPFCWVAPNMMPNYAIYSLDPMSAIPRFCYTRSGERVDKIPDWELRTVQAQYDRSEKSR